MSRHATAFLMSSAPKMLGAMRWKMASCTLSCFAKRSNSAISVCLHLRWSSVHQTKAKQKCVWLMTSVGLPRKAPLILPFFERVWVGHGLRPWPSKLRTGRLAEGVQPLFIYIEDWEAGLGCKVHNYKSLGIHSFAVYMCHTPGYERHVSSILTVIERCQMPSRRT